MCDGDLNTPLTDVQLCARQTEQKLKFNNIIVTLAFPWYVPYAYTSESNTITVGLTIVPIRYTKPFNSLEELFDIICNYFT